MSYDFTSYRLFVDAPIAEGDKVVLTREQANYLLNVLRLKGGAELLIFNGRDGEWRAVLSTESRKSAVLLPRAQTRVQPAASDLHYLFAPLKQARLDYMVQKAVEMGASSLQPILTQHTQVTRINADRMRSNAIEAAEQCGILILPEILEETRLKARLATWPEDRWLIFCDEDAPVKDPREAFDAAGIVRGVPLAVLIGPEGGFDSTERSALLALPRVIRLSLGQRILRADTAAVAALALVQAFVGDWKE
jgi:16S rRNA (uracil1498-N3)-methyltransferase